MLQCHLDPPQCVLMHFICSGLCSHEQDGATVHGFFTLKDSYMAFVFSLLANTAVLKTFVHVFMYSFKYFMSQFSKSRIAATKGLKFYNIYRD